MEETIDKILKDCEEIGRFKGMILEAASKDHLHQNNPEKQIHTIAYEIVNPLLNDNENGKNNELIGFYYHVCKSLKELVKYKKTKKEIAL